MLMDWNFMRSFLALARALPIEFEIGVLQHFQSIFMLIRLHSLLPHKNDKNDGNDFVQFNMHVCTLNCMILLML